MTRKVESMTVYTATPEMCHTDLGYGEHLLPYDWPGKKFSLDEGGSVVRLDPDETSFARRWNITGELALKIKGSVENTGSPAETVTTEETPTDPELTALKAENERLNTTITMQSEELDRLRRLADRVGELSDFKRRVGEVAMEYAERHDWCSTVEEALDELGIETPRKEYTFTLSVVYQVRGTKETYGEPDAYGIRSSMYLSSEDVSLSLGDWGDLDVEVADYDVMNIEEVQE